MDLPSAQLYMNDHSVQRRRLSRLGKLHTQLGVNIGATYDQVLAKLGRQTLRPREPFSMALVVRGPL